MAGSTARDHGETWKSSRMGETSMISLRRGLFLMFLGGYAVISPFDAWAVKRALVGHDLTDTLPGVSRMLRPVVEHLGTLPSAEQRGIAWQGLLCICPIREQLAKAVDDADPGGSPPEVEFGQRSAHLGHLA